MRKASLLSKVVDRLRYVLFNQECVGVDKVGNKYFRHVENGAQGEVSETRTVDLADKDYNPNNVPPEWQAWLHKFRLNPPTQDEMDKIEANRLSMKKKIAAIEEEEKKRQFRKRSLEAQGMSEEGGPDMSSFLKELSSKGFAVDKDAMPGGQSVSHETQPKEPPSRTTSQEPSGSDESVGSGGTFKPGTWQPGK